VLDKGVLFSAMMRNPSCQARLLMASEDDLLYRDLLIVNELGLHARSAAKLAKLAQTADKGVWIEAAGQRADAKQLLDLLTLGAAQGDRIRIGIESATDLPALEQIVGLIQSGFGE
jgi:phosphocarrier protein